MSKFYVWYNSRWLVVWLLYECGIKDEYFKIILSIREGSFIDLMLKEISTCSYNQYCIRDIYFVC